ncbi:MAG: alpha/beta hydrolase [Solirubrobacterales bacterium]|nr:alpha/beta hydrolase [Solirubrobacterales bacterium]MCB8915383.1 alpha/beta hydrolase [Thermoleophilales bacterium]
MALEEERFDGGSTGIAWRRLGEGPPLLLINGYAATKDDWDPAFLGGLAARSTVICPDNRGIGESARGVHEVTIGSMATDLVSLLDDLRIREVDVAGWSMGGFIAQKLVTWIPDRVKSLTLLATDTGGTRAHRRSPEVDAELTDRTGSPEEQADRLIDLLFPAGFAAQVKSGASEIVAAARARLDPEVLAEQEQAMADWYGPSVPPIDRISELARKGLPVLIAHGLDDRVIPARNSRVLSGALEDAWLARFPGGGHAFMAQEPERLSSLMSLFLAR